MFPPPGGFPITPGNFNNPPPFSVPPPGFGNAPHPHAGAPWGIPPWGMPPQAAQPQPTPPKNLIIKPGVIDPGVISRAAEWSEHRAPDGRPYYYHAGRGESVWEKPQAIRDLEAARLAAHSGAPPASPIIPPTNMPPRPLMPANAVVIPTGPVEHLGFPPLMGPPGTGQLIDPMISNQVVNDNKSDNKQKKKENADTENAKSDQNDKSQNKKTAVVDKSRPVSSTPISGTPWCVVWTGDGRVFYYNPSTRSSVWERPAELKDRPDVDKAVASCPKNVQCSAPENNSESEKSHETENNQEFEIPAKKAKLAEPKVEKDATKEAAIEAEVRASKERALVPLEQRVKSFKEMLREKDVSAFSTWEKELHKIVFDPRYLLLTSRERKQIFEKYVKDRAEEERKEKRNKMRQKRENFRDLLESANLHSKSSFIEFSSKYGRDDRFKAIEKGKERESLFNEFIIEVRKREREEKMHQKENIKKKFLEMLKEKSDITRHTRWSDVKKRFESDSRYKAVDSSFLREEYFNDYCYYLKEEKKKNKEKDRERDKDKKDRDKDKDKDQEKDRDKSSKKKNKDKEKHKKDEGDDSDKSLDKNENDISKSDEEIEKKQKERDRQLRAEQSIKEREKEVQRSLANHLRDRDKEREHHKREEAMRNFNALLADLVRNPDLTWKEVKRQLKKDHRWEQVEYLEREDREKLFNVHIDMLVRKKRDNFREMLDEQNLNLTATWKDVKKAIKSDPRYLKYSSSEKCEREFKDYLRDKTIEAKASLRELLLECKLITHKSFESVQENPLHLKEIEDILKNDKRYLMLDHMDHERSQIILSYLEDLHKKGPPPPPTATETTRRK
ncbi:transcription elongation regulator 1 isoform X2 [Condylostylus longicornis]|nr:transcription elongation regulator 1 isoform X2 [Condylostylus longicornis]